MWQGNRVSVVLPTFNERSSIYQCIQDFDNTGVVDEILVVNNNAADGTSDEVARTNAREIFESRQGYGFAIRRGLREATGEYIVVCEPDGTFLARDIYKLLAFAGDVDVVYGSRTSGTFIWQGANMGFFLRWGNWAVAKMMELLFNSSSLTDVGCTLRLVTRQGLQLIEPHLSLGGNAFGLEMMLLSLIHGLRVTQIPVNYLPRVGVSSVTGDIRKAVLLGVWMTLLIWRSWLRHWLSMLGPRPRVATGAGGRR